MFSFIILIVFSVGFVDVLRADEVPCETGQTICPRGSRCVSGVGCVASNATNCRDPAQPCVWPQESNCKGGCALRECTATKGCGKRINPTNACQVTVCRQNKCVSAELACDQCDPKSGCKPGTRDVTGQEGDEPKVKDVASGDVTTTDYVEGVDVTLESWWDEKRGIVIGISFTIALVGGSMLALAIYFAFIVTKA